MKRPSLLLLGTVVIKTAAAFVTTSCIPASIQEGRRTLLAGLLLVDKTAHQRPNTPRCRHGESCLFASPNDQQQEERLQSTFGGYTVKQRLREEVESPFRPVRLYFLGYSTVSAAVALYFSAFNAAKLVATTTADSSALLNDALQSCAINVGALVLFAYLTYRDWQAGNVNLERIARGGQLAKLRVVTGATGERRNLASYRRQARLCLAVGSQSYIETLCRTLSADQLSDTNTLVQGLTEADVIIVPVLLQKEEGSSSTSQQLVVGDSRQVWQATQPQAGDRHFDVHRADAVLAFPAFLPQYTDYLQSEIATCQAQGFNVLDKGFVLVIKKNGKILRRATGQPPLPDLIGTMQVLDRNFGMPGDTEKYGGA
jgi:hypothetical protein